MEAEDGVGSLHFHHRRYGGHLRVRVRLRPAPYRRAPFLFLLVVLGLRHSLVLGELLTDPQSFAGFGPALVGKCRQRRLPRRWRQNRRPGQPGGKTGKRGTLGPSGAPKRKPQQAACGLRSVDLGINHQLRLRPAVRKCPIAVKFLAPLATNNNDNIRAFHPRVFDRARTQTDFDQ